MCVSRQPLLPSQEALGYDATNPDARFCRPYYGQVVTPAAFDEGCGGDSLYFFCTVTGGQSSDLSGGGGVVEVQNNTLSFTITIIETENGFEQYKEELRTFFANEFNVKKENIIITVAISTRMRALASGLVLTIKIIDQTKDVLEPITDVIRQLQYNPADGIDFLVERGVRIIEVGQAVYLTTLPPAPPPALPSAPAPPSKIKKNGKNQNQIIDGVVACARDTFKMKKCDKKMRKNQCDPSCTKKQCKKTQRKCKSTCKNGCVPGILPTKGDPDYLG